MPRTEYQKAYAIEHKHYLNRRRLLCNYAQKSSTPVSEYSAYEKIHGLEKTIDWLRIKSKELKLNKLKIDLELKVSVLI